MCRRTLSAYDLAEMEHHVAATPVARDLVSALSPREREVLEMTVTGSTNAEIARQLSVTPHAVKFHLAAVYRKLAVANRTEAAVMYLQWTFEKPLKGDDT